MQWLANFSHHSARKILAYKHKPTYTHMHAEYMRASILLNDYAYDIEF